MNVNEILAVNETKTWKIQQLLLQGLTRREVAILITNNNYGFVQNVYAKMKAQGLFENLNINTFNRRFGVEFEAYNVTKETLKTALLRAGINVEIEGYNHTTRSNWKIVTDASLSGNETFELVSPVLEGENGLQQINTVCKTLNECGAKVNKSCGTHIHFDAAALDLDWWKKIYINYARLERVIDSFMPLSRRKSNNMYSKSLCEIRSFESKINAAHNLRDIENIFNSRYFKINPQSYSRHNTIEFRQHSGTVESDKIIAWIKFLNNLVNFSKTTLATEAGIEGLATFNPAELVNFLKQRKQKLA